MGGRGGHTSVGDAPAKLSFVGNTCFFFFAGCACTGRAGAEEAGHMMYT